MTPGATIKMGCRICGGIDSTKSHLIPAAMARDALKGDKHLVSGSRFVDGMTKTQSGLWDDDILCLSHEKMLGDADSAAINFCRRVQEQTLIIKPDVFTVGGVDVDQIVKFVAAVLWRCSVSQRFGMHEFNLGAAAEKKLAAILFHGTPVGDFPLVSINAVCSDIPDVEGVINYPKLLHAKGARLVRFMAAGMIFTAEIGWKKLPLLARMRINGQTQIVTGFVPFEKTIEFLSALPVVESMGRKRSGGPMRQRKPKKVSDPAD